MPCGKTYTALVARAGAGRTQPDAAPRTTAVFRKGRKGMALTWVWVGMVCVALIYGAATGQSAAVGAAAAQGVQQAVTFCLTVGGMICLWSGVMEVSGLCPKIAEPHPVFCKYNGFLFDFTA